MIVEAEPHRVVAEVVGVVAARRAELPEEADLLVALLVHQLAHITPSVGMSPLATVKQ